MTTSSLSLSRKLWEASFPLLGFCKLSEIDVLVTIDKYAVRCWGLLTVSSSSFVVIYSSRIGCGGYIELWTHDVRCTQRVELDYCPIVHAHMSTDRPHLSISDVAGNVMLLSIQFMPLKNGIEDELVPVHATTQRLIEVSELQVLTCLDDAKACGTFTLSNFLVIWSASAVQVYKYNSADRSGNLENFDCNATPAGSQYSYCSTVYVQRQEARVTKACICPQGKLLCVGLDDGHLTIFLQRLDQHGAHYDFVASYPLFLTAIDNLEICDWSPSCVPSSEYELIAYNDGRRVTHVAFSFSQGGIIDYRVLGSFCVTEDEWNRKGKHGTCSMLSTLRSGPPSGIRGVCFAFVETLFVLAIELPNKVVKLPSANYDVSYALPGRSSDDGICVLMDDYIASFDETGCLVSSINLQAHEECNKSSHLEPSCFCWGIGSVTAYVGYRTGQLGVVNRDGTIRLFPSEHHSLAISRMLVTSSKPHHLVVADSSGMLSVITLREAGPLLSTIASKAVHRDEIISVCEVFMGSSALLLTASKSGDVKLWRHVSKELMLVSCFRCLDFPIKVVFPLTFIEVGATKETNIIVLCGSTNGLLQCWLLSTKSENCLDFPIARCQLSSSVNVIEPFSDFSSSSSLLHSLVSCFCINGHVEVLRIYSSGAMERINYYCLPSGILHFNWGSKLGLTSNALILVADRGTLDSKTDAPVTDNQDEVMPATIRRQKNKFQPAAENRESAKPSATSNSRPQFRDYMKEVMDDIFAVEYHHTFNNAALIQSFRHHATNKGVVSVENAISILVTWLDDSNVKRENVSGLLSTVGVAPMSMLNFEQLARIATVFSSFLKPKKQSEIFPEYRQLRLTAKRVIYGDFVTTAAPDIKVVDGISSGCVEALRKNWNSQEARVYSHLPKSHAFVFSTALQRLPEHFGVASRLIFPKTWSYRDSSWLRPDSLIRIGREVLTRRHERQQCLYSVDPRELEIEEAKIPTLPGLLKSFFEKLYGAEQITIPFEKLFQFLESTVQLACFPIINILKNLLLQGTSSSVWAASCTSLLTELRGILLARKLISLGSCFDFTNFGSPHCPERHHLVAKESALHCIVNLLKIRGGYGPVFIQSIIQKIQQIPAIDGDMVDFEVLLETFIMEYQNCMLYLKDVTTAIFKCEEPLADPLLVCSRFDHSHVLLMIIPFLRADCNRQGVVSQDEFSMLLMEILKIQDPTINPSYGRPYRLLIECTRRFSVIEGLKHSICYIDFFSLLLSWLDKNEHAGPISAPILLEAITYSKIGLEHDKAALLLDFLCLSSSMNRRDPLWMFSKYEAHRVPTDGDFILSSFTFKENDEASLSAIGEQVASHNLNIFQPRKNGERDLNTQRSVEIIPTTRSFYTIHGEVCKRLEFERKVKPFIHNVTVGDDFVKPPGRIQVPTQSFSRAVADIVIDESFNSKVPTLNSPLKLRENASYSSLQLDVKEGKDASGHVSYLQTNDLLNRELLKKECDHLISQRLARTMIRNKLSMVSAPGHRRRRRLNTTVSTRGLHSPSHQLLDSHCTEGAIQTVDISNSESVQDKSRWHGVDVHEDQFDLRSRVSQDSSQGSTTRSTLQISSSHLTIVDDHPITEITETADPTLYTVQTETQINDLSLPFRNNANCEIIYKYEHEDFAKMDETVLEYAPDLADAGVIDNDINTNFAEIADEGEDHHLMQNENQPIGVDVEEQDQYDEDVIENRGLDSENAKESENEAEIEDENGEIIEDDQENLPKLEPEAIPVVRIIPCDSSVEQERRVPPSAVLDFRLVNKIKAFIGTLNKSSESNSEHPRRKLNQSDGTRRLFLPQIFSSDIQFDAFEAPSYSLISANPGTMPHVTDNANQQLTIGKIDFFKDIQTAVREHKKSSARQRVEQLYSTSDSEIPASDWTKMYVKGIPDWKKYFDGQKIASHEEKSPSPILDTPPLPPLFVNETCDIKPLPSFAAFNSTILRGERHYYQVLPANEGNLITIEVESSYGYIAMYCGDGYLPHDLKYDHHCSSSAKEHPVQISWQSTSRQPIIIAIHSSEHYDRCEYAMKKFESDCAVADKASAERFRATTKITSKLNILSAHSLEDLQLKFPMLDNAAEQQTVNQISPHLLHFPKDPPSLRDNETGNVLENSIMKAGRVALRREYKTHRGKIVDPNMHVDLFPRIKVHHHSQKLATLSTK